MNSLFRELKQRRVYRAAIGYAVIGWLVIQVSPTVIPAYHGPEWGLADLHHSPYLHNLLDIRDRH